jgi:hypothetical protein
MIRTLPFKGLALITTNRHFKLSKLKNAVQQDWLSAAEYKQTPTSEHAQSGWVWLGSARNVKLP